MTERPIATARDLREARDAKAQRIASKVVESYKRRLVHSGFSESEARGYAEQLRLAPRPLFSGPGRGQPASEKEWEAAQEALRERAMPDWLGVDVGFIYPAADSDGQVWKWANQQQRRATRGQVTSAGPVTIKRADGSVVGERPAYGADQIADISARGRDENHLLRIKILASRIVAKARGSNRGIALEDWDSFKRRRSAWMPLYRSIITQAQNAGVPIRTVNKAYTSQTCPECGHVSKSNRPTRNQFRCTRCNYSGQADVVAALNISARGDNGGTDKSRACTNPPCDRPIWKAKLCCACYFYRRRHGDIPSPETLEALAVARNYQDFTKIVGENPRFPSEPAVS